MNRSPLPTQDVIPSLLPVSKSDFDWTREFDETGQVGLQRAGASHCLFAPIHYEQRYAYPLIVWLHSGVSNEQELREVMPLVSVRNYVAVAPRGTDRVEGIRGAFTWNQSPSSIETAMDRVRQCVETAQERFRIHRERIFIAGYAAGGTMAIRLGLEYPDQFAGAISLGGAMPRGSRPLKRIAEARKLPLLLSVSPSGSSDLDGYSLDQVMADVRLLHSAGSSLSVRLYPEGDGLTTVMLSDVDNWIMERACPQSIVSTAS
ncbi:MAG: hypothetical protein KDA57_07165 [Planctomycetales bacterium]|nr:hypothetical protein [Planctomycetales bacterium]